MTMTLLSTEFNSKQTGNSTDAAVFKQNKVEKEILELSVCRHAEVVRGKGGLGSQFPDLGAEYQSRPFSRKKRT